MSLKHRVADYLLGDERQRLQESARILYEAYLEGPYQLTPDQLMSQLKEQDSALLTDLVHQLYWETIGSADTYYQDTSAARIRAVNESRRLWRYNTLAQWVIWLWTNFGFGETVQITLQNEDANEIFQEFWTSPRNEVVLAPDNLADRLSNWLLVDGDVYLAFYGSVRDGTGETTVRIIGTTEIQEIIADPDDAGTSLFYKRSWTDSKNVQRTWYYPDWQAFFNDEEALNRADLPTNAIRADKQNGSTTVCIMHVRFNSKDPQGQFGWPLLAAGSPWIRAQKRFMEDRLAVSAAKAMYVRKTRVKGGSRAVSNVINRLASALSSTSSAETNPPAIAGSTYIENEATDTSDFPMTTGAADAKTDHEGFAWMALLGGGVFPHWAGMGDAYRLATATAMESPIQRQFSRYQTFFATQFRRIVKIVLLMAERYGGASFEPEDYEAEVSIDKLVEVDLSGITSALGQMFSQIIKPMVELGAIPPEVLRLLLQSTIRTLFAALGVDAEPMVEEEIWPVPEEPEEPAEGPESPEPEPGEPPEPEEPTGPPEAEELPEAIMSALLNYREGAIDADDLIEFLAPVQLERALAAEDLNDTSLGPGHPGPPKGAHGSGPRGGSVPTFRKSREDTL